MGSVMESSAGRRNSGSVAHDDGMHEEDEEECHGGKYCAVVPLTMAGIGVMSSGCTKCVTTCVTSVNLCVCVHICLVDYQVGIPQNLAQNRFCISSKESKKIFTQYNEKRNKKMKERTGD